MTVTVRSQPVGSNMPSAYSTIMPATAARYGVTGDQKMSVEKKLSNPRINI